MVCFANRVPMVGKLHVKQIENTNFIALIRKVTRHAVVQLGLGVRQDQALVPLNALENKRPDKAPALARLWRACYQQISRKPCLFAGGNIVLKGVVIQRVILVLAIHCTPEIIQPANVQYLLHFTQLHKTGRSMCAVRQDVKAALVLYRMITAQPLEAFPRQQAAGGNDRNRNENAGRRERGDQVEERVCRPDVRDPAACAECLMDTEPDRVNKHAVKVPCSNTQQCVQLPAPRMPLAPASGFFQPPVFQFCNLIRQAAHAHRPLSAS